MTSRRKTKQTNGTRTGANHASTPIHRSVKAMAARGLVEDQIALRIGSDKNQLRRRYIDAIKAGRAKKQEVQAAAEASELSRPEQARLDAITHSFNSHWYTPDLGNLLFGGAHTIEQAIAWCEEHSGGRPWITTGLPGVK